MNYAFMSFSCPQLSLDEILSYAKEVGYNGIEPRAGSGHSHGIELDTSTEQRKEIKAKATDSGVALCCLAVSCRYADPNTADAQVDETRQYVDLAADVGSPRLRVFGGKIPDGISREQAIESVSQALSSIADHAGAAGVTICLETHDDWCDPAHVAAVMQNVNHAAIAVNWDILHPIRAVGSTLGQAFETLKPWIRHTHVHDATIQPGKIDYVAMGTGGVDHKEAMGLLKADGYTGYLSGEWIGWEAHDVHLPRELAAMKAYESELV